MALFRRRSRDADLIDDLASAMQGASHPAGSDARPGGRPFGGDVLATGHGPGCAVVLTRARFAVRQAWTPPAADASEHPIVPVDVFDNGTIAPRATTTPTTAPRVTAPSADGAWRWWDWQQVQGGTWNGESHRLLVRLLDGEQIGLALDQPGEVPAVFAERVQSSILVEENVRVPGGEVIVSGRRAPVAAGRDGHRPPVVWHALAVGGVDLRRPEVSARVVAATQRLAADYDLG